jgi:DNA-binding transcriptional LysR family regulator
MILLFSIGERSMDLSDLTILRAVVEAGGITRAATRLNRVQSNITTRVRHLEEDLGVKLFLREGKKLRLTPAGSTLLEYAHRLLDLAQEARTAISDPTPKGLFRIGAMESTAAVRLPKPLCDYHRRYPEVTLELKTGNPQQLKPLLEAGALDAIIVPEASPDARFETVTLFNETFIIAARKDHPPIRSAQDIAGATMLVFERGCPHRKRLEDFFNREREIPGRVIEMTSYHALLGCVAAGMGVSLMPMSVLETFPERKQISVHRLPRGQDSGRIVLMWRKGLCSPKIAALVDSVTKEITTRVIRKRK